MADYFSAEETAALIAVPGEHDDKYSRGVLGVMTGSQQYPGAAVLGVEAAMHTGVGMVRYVGPERPTTLVLQRRPETVAASGRVQAWLLGSGMDASSRDAEVTDALERALGEGLPVVLDAGALDLADRAAGPLVVTPHRGELARMLDADPGAIAADPAAWAERAADRLGATVLLKGHTTHVVGAGVRLRARSAPAWLATAGSGDALGGILGALLATHARAIAQDATLVPRLAAAAAVLHGLAGERASGGGPVTVLGLVAALPATIAGLLASRA